MRPVLLSLSVVLNVVLVAFVAWRWSASEPLSGSPPFTALMPDGKQVGETAAPPSSAASDALSPSFDWRKASPDEIMAELRRSGAPNQVLVLVASGLVNERYRERLHMIGRPVDAPRWWHGRSVPRTPELRAAHDQMREEVQAEIRRLLGQDPMMLLAESTARSGLTTRFGNLCPETVAQVVKIESDYDRIRMNQGRGVDAELLLEQELAKDLSVVLTGDELADYMAFNSRFASRLQQRLADAELTDADYLLIYGAADVFRREFRADPEYAKMPESSPTYRVRELAHLREAASDSVVAGIALRQDPDFQRIVKATEQTGAPPEQIVSRYEAYLFFMSELERIEARSGGLEETLRLSKPAAKRAYDALTEGLDESGRSGFEQTPVGRHMKRILDSG